MTNNVSITSDDGDDIDSDPNTGDDVDEDNDGAGDDDDEAGVSIAVDQFVDLALRKLLSDPTAQASVFDDVEFDLVLFNQGTLPVFNVEVIDYIQTGFVLSPNDTNGWTLDANGDARLIFAGPLVQGTNAVSYTHLTLPTKA